MNLPDLDIKCWKCWGSGIVSAVENHGEVIECPECGGVGYIPTDEGLKILEFLQRHLSFDLGEEE